MRSARTLCAAAAAVLAAVAGGCGLGTGPAREGEATLRVTRDYGRELMLEATLEDPTESETVLRFLDREAAIETRYGGGFVQSIAGVGGGIEDGRRYDWFFYVNGIESPVGSAERPVEPGDRVWWDHHDWTSAMRVPAVVGEWPEPFLQASAGADRLPVRVVCATVPAPCRRAAERLAAAGVEASIEPYRAGGGASAEALRLLVGPWRALRDDPAAHRLADEPAVSGVFARFAGAGPATRLLALDERAQPQARLGRDAGLVAALRDRDRPPTWVATGIGAAGVEAAVGLLGSEQLEGRFAVAGREARALPLPVTGNAPRGGDREPAGAAGGAGAR